MDKLNQMLECELNSLLMQMPEKNGKSVSSMLKRMKFVESKMVFFKDKLNLIGNQFLIKNNLNEKEVETLKELLNSYYFKFSTSYAKKR